MTIRHIVCVLSCLVIVASAAAAESPGAELRDQIATLKREIARHDELYHRKAAPEITDADYDMLRQRLAALERGAPDAARATPRLAEVGDDRSGLFQTYRHVVPMLSLEKAFAASDVRAFHARLVRSLGRADLEYIVEPKYDGLAISVTFTNGKLVRAVTRGNGAEGDDITANVLRITGLPHELRQVNETSPALPEHIEIRGEIYVPSSEFDRVNVERDAAGEPRFANARNLAAGTVRQVDARDVVSRGLRVVFFGVGDCVPEARRPQSQRALHGALAAWGLPTIEKSWVARGLDDLLEAIETMDRARAGLPFPTDGAVIKLDSAADQRAVGASDAAPRGSLAYKFAPERVETKVLGITLQVGRTGVLTPVAELEPVQIAGSKVARATLHNREEIARKDVRIGDYIYLEKAGDVIPAVVGVNLERRSSSAEPFGFPIACPSCYTALTKSDVEVAVRCPNYACPAQVRRRVEHFASKGCLDIDNLGPAMVEVLVGNGWVKDVPDLYRLNRADLLTLGKNNEKTVTRLMAAIEKSKGAELWRVIYGLGLSHVGASTAKDLARQCGSLAALAEHGPAAAAVLGESRYQNLIAELIAVGVAPTAPSREAKPAAMHDLHTSSGERANAVSGGQAARFAGKTFVLTGTLPTLSRAQAAEKIERAGGKIANTVSRKTHYAVVGREPGAKLAQVRELAIPILDEAALLRMIEEEEVLDDGRGK